MGLALVIVAAGASTAFAAVTLSSSGPFAASDTITEVEVTAPASAPFNEAKYVTIAECNLIGVVGQRCNKASASSLTELKPGLGGSATFEEVNILRNYFDTDFTVQPPATSAEFKTLCKNTIKEGEQCGITASYYSASFQQLGSESADIVFE